MSSQLLTRPAAAPPTRTRSGLLLAVLLGGQFMAILDVSVVNVATATIQADLHASGAALQLVVAGYTIAYAVCLITGARLGDRLSHRRVFLAGLAVFTVASLACGLAPTTGALVALRFGQGFGAALLVPQVFSLIQRTVPPPLRPRAFGLYAAVIAGATVVGQVAGGLLVSADVAGAGWRPVFLVNVPVGLLLLVLAARVLPRDHGEPGRALDLPGLLTLATAVLLLVVPLVLGHEEHWPLWCWLLLAGSVPAFGVFALTQRRATAPLVPGVVLRAPGVGPALAALFAAMAAYAGFLFATALHLQLGLDYPALRAGLTFAVGATGFALASLNWRRLPASWQPRLPAVGLSVGALGLAATAVGVHAGTGLPPLFWLGQALFGLGFGASFAPLITVALARVPVTLAADASGLLTTMTQLAQVIGVATFGTLYLTRHPSGSALAVVCALGAAAALVAALAALPLTRRR